MTLNNSKDESLKGLALSVCLFYLIPGIPKTEEEVAIAEKEMEHEKIELPEELTDIEKIWKRLQAKMV